MRKWMIPAALGLVLLVAVSAWGYNQYLANRSLENFLNNRYQQAFFDMSNQVQNLEVLLSKSMVASDPRLDSTFLTDIRQQAAFAQSNLGQLPLNDAVAARTAQFLTQVGDYSDSLVRQVSRGEAINPEQWNTLNGLYKQSVELHRDLEGMQARLAENRFYFGSFLREVQNTLPKPPGNLAATDFQNMDERMQRYPTLIYDGPFSEHLERAEPRALSGLGDITPEEAQQKALSFVDKRPDVNYQAAVSGSTEGRIPAYRVEVSPAGGGDSTVLDISKQGGKVIWMFNDRPTGEPAIDMDAARQKALQFLKDRSYGEMRPTYFMRHANSVTYNFAAVQDGVTLYPDLVKVTVALDNGEVTGAETTGYLMSHWQRDLPKAKLTQEQARATISPHLKDVEGGNLVFIPIGVTAEKLAYEFKGKLGEDTYLVHVNAENGREENVLKLIETPGGMLTM